MPSRNTRKTDVPAHYYHVYARGLDKQTIFRDSDDFTVFLSFFIRYLSTTPTKNAKGNPYAHLREGIELVAFCLMSNHFHLLLYQHASGAMAELMQKVLTSYSMYFNSRYKRSGPLFESRYKASLISSDAYLLHISRYIHLNPYEWETYPYSSLAYYLQYNHADWVSPERVLGLFVTPSEYIKFVADYTAQKQMLDEIKGEMAHT